MRFTAPLLFAVLGALVGSGHAQETSPPIEVRQAWASAGAAYATTDSLAACALPSGPVRVFATAKDGDRVDVFDAANGTFVRSFGRPGSAAGELKYPNGIATVRCAEASPATTHATPQELIVVVERDNHRLQGFWPETLQPAGLCGATELRSPYGVGVSYRPEGTFLYVTQANVPAKETVHVFRLRLVAGRLQAEHVRAFGDEQGPGAIGKAESVVIDDELDRVLLCDEANKNVKVYDRDGKFTGSTFADGLVIGDPEGLVLWLDNGPGFIILTDQRKALTVWHVFNRRTLRHVASFTGQPPVANTDGVCLYAEPFASFPRGAFFAVNDDADVRAYSLAVIADALHGAPPPAARPPAP